MKGALWHWGGDQINETSPDQKMKARSLLALDIAAIQPDPINNALVQDRSVQWFRSVN